VWTNSQRVVVLAIVCGLLLYISLRYWHDPVYLPDPLPQTGDRSTQVASRLDPNTATTGQLAAIPSIGDKLAATIIDYRQRKQREHPGQTVFTSIYSLMSIRGIGPAKLQTLSEYLTFPPKPTTSSATTRSTRN
jgi:Helix-hairpin-helix motif